jgi:hypothetical protein
MSYCNEMHGTRLRCCCDHRRCVDFCFFRNATVIRFTRLAFVTVTTVWVAYTTSTATPTTTAAPVPSFSTMTFLSLQPIYDIFHDLGSELLHALDYELAFFVF